MEVNEVNKQSEIYGFLKSYTEEKGYPPSIREICEAVSLSSTSTVHKHLMKLENKGLVRRDSAKPRAIELLEFNSKKIETLKIPIVSDFVEGVPILDSENTFSLPIDFIKSNRALFVFKVNDESMKNINVRNGDMVIIEKNKNVFNKDIVLALVKGQATIKRYFKERGYIRLQSENDTKDSIFIESCVVLGKMIGMFREY